MSAIIQDTDGPEEDNNTIKSEEEESNDKELDNEDEMDDKEESDSELESTATPEGEPEEETGSSMEDVLAMIEAGCYADGSNFDPEIDEA